MCRVQSKIEEAILKDLAPQRFLYKFSPNTVFPLLRKQMPLKRGAKLGMVPEDQLSILLASALNSSMIKASLFH